ncbi:MAG: hypothetical protein QOD74_185 [Variibacter sp.]|nr:hypothetical protein [Variibacter sp.]
MADAGENVWTVPVRLDAVPAHGREIKLVADEEVRVTVARQAGVRGLPRLEAHLELRPRGKDALHVIGEVSATVEQTCSVTLEPVVNEVNEPVDVVFSDAPDPRHGLDEQGHIAGDGPEPLVGGAADLGALAVEFLMLGIDPFPRKPDAEFAAPKQEAGADNPFAVLAGLKARAGNKD